MGSGLRRVRSLGKPTMAANAWPFLRLIGLRPFYVLATSVLLAPMGTSTGTQAEGLQQLLGSPLSIA